MMCRHAWSEVGKLTGWAEPPNLRRGFGGGGSTTTVQPVTSPAQEAAIEALMPYELGIARAGTQAALGLFDPTIQATQGALKLSPEERALPGRMSQINLPLARGLNRLATGLGGTMEGLEGPLPSSILEPAREEFIGTVLPGISSAAIRAGAPGGSAEQALTTQAVGQYGRNVTSVLEQTAADRLSALSRAMGIESGVGQQIGQLMLAGPMASAQLGEKGRQLDVESAGIPWQMAQQMLGMARGISVPWAGQGSITTSKQDVPIGQQIMQGMQIAAMIAALAMA